MAHSQRVRVDQQNLAITCLAAKCVVYKRRASVERADKRHLLRCLAGLGWTESAGTDWLSRCGPEAACISASERYCCAYSNAPLRFPRTWSATQTPYSTEK